MTKLSVDSRVQFLALFEPFTHSTGAAVSGNRPGEVFAGIQAVILPGDDEKRPTISAQYLRRLYASPAPELDLGTFVQSATILLSENLGGFHFDMNGLVTEQQDDTTKLRRAQFAQTLSISHPIGRFTVSGEVWHFAQPLTHGYAVGNLWAASYFCAQQSRDRCRLRSWLYHHIDALGGLCRFYVSSAASTLAPKEQRLLMRHDLEIACWWANDRIGQDDVRSGSLAGSHL